MTAQARGVTLQAADRDGILRGLVSLPAHLDVRASLERLKAAGFRLVTLTNSAPAAVEQQLANAGIREFFERALSVDAVRKFKPAGRCTRSPPKSCQCRRRNFASSQRTPGTSSERCALGTLQRSSLATGRRCFRWLNVRISSLRI